MSDSIWHRGLPDSFFTRRKAVVVGLTVGIVLVLAFSSYASYTRYVTEPTTAPACYWLGEAKYEPGDLAPLISDYDRRDGRYVERLMQAQQQCSPRNCEGAALEAYRSALFWYLAPRLRHTRNLDREYGDAGLRAAALIYGTPVDREVEQGLRDRYRAKLFRINNLRNDRDAVAILIFKGGEALRPWRKSDAALVSKVAR